MDQLNEFSTLGSDPVVAVVPANKDIDKKSQNILQSAGERSDSPEVNSFKPKSSALSVFETWVLIAAIALFIGFSESIWMAIQRFGMGEFLHAGTQRFWMSPATNLLVASIIGIPFYFIAARTRHCTEDLVAIVFSFLGAISLIALIPKMMFVAHVILATGVAVQMGRWTQRHPHVLIRWAKKSLPVFVVAFGVLLVCIHRYEHRSNASLGPVPASMANAPNVLLIVLDTVRAESVVLDGGNTESRTPNMKRLAEQGFVFKQTRSTSPWTLPSHASLLTSKLPGDHQASWKTPMDSKPETIAQWLQDRGYRTGAFVANRWYCTSETGLNRGFSRYDDSDISLGSMFYSTAWGRRFSNQLSMVFGWQRCENGGRRNAASIRKSAVNWIGDSQKQPYFAMLNYFDAHDPYVAPESYRLAKDDDKRQHENQLREWWGLDKSEVTAEMANFQRRAYEECIAYLDDEIGLLMKQLESNGALDNTLVIITSDHGEHFGDHELYGHGNSLYDPSIHVPLILWQPSKVPTGSTQTPVSLREIPSTIVDHVGSDERQPFDCESLTRFWKSERPLPWPVISEISGPSLWPACNGRSPVFRGAMRSVVWKGYKYILNGDGVEEAYSLSSDAQEQYDLIDQLEPTILQELRNALDGKWKGQREQANESVAIDANGNAGA